MLINLLRMPISYDEMIRTYSRLNETEMQEVGEFMAPVGQ